MSNPVSQYGFIAQAGGVPRASTDKTEKKNGGSLAASAQGAEAAATASAASVPTAAPARNANDVLDLSNVTDRIKAEPEIDRAKVDAIKKALQNGQYPLNARRTAESFVALEQLIRD
ncbi:MAG: flagellar biosynthesis anti-sigma factor FlgM [Burkholderiales bacterium]|nr:flagellar biosynthesis anti-sigma factor FlgM [Burkholderiales bacterium]